MANKSTLARIDMATNHNIKVFGFVDSLLDPKEIDLVFVLNEGFLEESNSSISSVVQPLFLLRIETKHQILH